jgi:PKD domain-containing protein
MNRRHRAAVPATVLVLAFAVAACEEDRVTTPPPVANPSPTPSPSSSATPSPAPTPTASPTPDANRPPTVTVTSSGSCHPVPGRPCTVSFNATANDPDGDRIAYGWDGCAQGNAPFVTCTIDRPGTVTATVLVDDGQGHVARASATASGVNLPPVVRLSGRPPDPAPSHMTFIFAGGQPYDPEEDEDPNRLCQRATVTATGPCRAGLSVCGGVGDAFDWDVTTLQGPGTCVVEARVADIWGAVGVDRFSFTVLP